jgi:hypothetical protein
MLPEPSAPHSPQDRDPAGPRDGGPQDRPTSNDDGPSGRISRFGGPRAVRQVCLPPVPRSHGRARQFGGCLRGPSTDSIRLRQGPGRCASVGSTEASNGRLARVGVVGPKHPGITFAARCLPIRLSPSPQNGYLHERDRAVAEEGIDPPGCRLREPPKAAPSDDELEQGSICTGWLSQRSTGSGGLWPTPVTKLATTSTLIPLLRKSREPLGVKRHVGVWKRFGINWAIARSPTPATAARTSSPLRRHADSTAYATVSPGHRDLAGEAGRASPVRFTTSSPVPDRRAIGRFARWRGAGLSPAPP